MPRKLVKEDIVTLKVLKKRGATNEAIGRTLGVTEGAVRYHLRRDGVEDGRRNKPRKAEAYADAIDQWIQAHQSQATDRPANVRELYEWLVANTGYGDSYKSVLRFVRARYPKPKLRPYRRVETPPGAQAQVDWKQDVRIDLGDGPERLHAFVMKLSYSRKAAVVWSRRMDQLSWHRAHNEAFRRLGGIPAVCRIDNLKTGIVRGAGPWGKINDAYRAYARAVGFHVDACLPYSPEAKGKVEREIQEIVGPLDLNRRVFDGLADLQRQTDETTEHRSRRRICPRTGGSVESAWREESELLRPIDVLPQAFDVATTRRVRMDCTISFEGRVYNVPFVLCGLSVEVRGCCETVQVVRDGRVVAEHPRGTEARLVIDPSYYEGPGDARTTAPLPLGKMGRRLQELESAPVQLRSIELYELLTEAAR